MKHGILSALIAASFASAVNASEPSEIMGRLTITKNGVTTTEETQNKSIDGCLNRPLSEIFFDEGMSFAGILCSNAEKEWAGSQNCTARSCVTIRSGQNFEILPLHRDFSH